MNRDLMHAIKLYSGILLIDIILLSGCGGMAVSEKAGQKAGRIKMMQYLFMRDISEKTPIR